MIYLEYTMLLVRHQKEQPNHIVQPQNSMTLFLTELLCRYKKKKHFVGVAC